MNIQMIISGIGGQGVLLLTRIFSAFTLKEGYSMIGSEDHGMSQRGGSVLTHIKIGDFRSPLVRRGDADILISLEKDEAYRTLSYLRPASPEREGGLCFINATNPKFLNEKVKEYLNERGIEVFVFFASKLAKEMGMVQSTNIALLGFATAHPRFPFPNEKLRDAIKEVTHPNFLDLNLRIFEKGFFEGKRIMGF